MRLLTLLQFMLIQIWQFFKLPFPGTDVPIGAILFFPMVVSIVMAFFRNIFGIGGFGQISENAISYRHAKKRDSVKTYNMKRTPSKGIRGIK